MKKSIEKPIEINLTSVTSIKPSGRRRWNVPLTVSHPGVADEALGWDPSLVTAGKQAVMRWKCRQCGHNWESKVYRRAVLGKGFCPKCPRPKTGSISLLEEYPNVAVEAEGWDPAYFSSHSGKIKTWRCRTCQWNWDARISHRTDPSVKAGCPRCAGKKTTSLAIQFPEIAREALGWDASKYTAGASTVLAWCCAECGTKWSASPGQRTNNPVAWGCPFCNGEAGRYREVRGQRVRIPDRYNSLLSRFPELSKELVDPSIAPLVSYGSDVTVPWYCLSCDTEWEASVNSRTTHRNGCPNCAKSGFKVDEVGFLYFLKANRKGKEVVQYGITKVPRRRVVRHRLNGFYVPKNSYFIKFPSGQDALDVENEIKAALVQMGVPSIMNDPDFTDKFNGYSESFRKELLPVESLTELLESLGIDFAKRECELVPVASLLGSEKRPLNK